jgi:c(7)-type cytochrome triheme protein
MPPIRSYRFWCFLGLVLFSIIILVVSPRAFSHGNLNLPELAAPEDYGNILINRHSTGTDVMPVMFSHWVHRANFTCRVCHVELEFSMKANDTGIICNRGTMTGKYCFACHDGKTDFDGKTAFAPKSKEGDNCNRCHNAFSSPNMARFAELKKKLPVAKFGNEIDWSKALSKGLIKPKKSLFKNYTAVTPDGPNRTLTLQAEMALIPPAVFPHKIHQDWLDCTICHPDIFNIKKKTTKHFSMERILNREFCGVCHLKIAFPLDDCKRCHPAMRN